MGMGSAVRKLQECSSEIARIAAGWQAGGHDTSPLAEPLVRIQEAIAELESLESDCRGAAPDYLKPSVRQAEPKTQPLTDG